ncbi:MAG: cation:proton antiporter [Planctomycetes bacterium]|nr:cation:proton antiporter [Planctomycetota bacterium]
MPDTQRSLHLRTWLVYAVMIASTVLVFLWIDSRGAHLEAPDPVGDATFGAGSQAARVDVLTHVLIALVVILVSARLLGNLFRRLHQPPVIGEVIAGIALGPSLLGRIAPEAQAFLLPQSVAPYLGILAQVGVILFMFVVGLELDPRLLRKRTHATVAISHASIIAPFLLGAAFALVLYPRFSSSDVPFTAFALFLGVSMSVTAFPVLARILTDRRLQGTRLGVIALTCAAVDDVTAWCLLAFVIGVTQSQLDSALTTVALTIAYIAFMFVVVRPVLERWISKHDAAGLTPGFLSMIAVGLLLSALATELIGVHALFGAFLLGAMMQHDSRIVQQLRERIEGIVLALFLPAFFAFTGMRTEIGLVHGLDQWLVCGAIVLVASLGKFGGSFATARMTGLGWRDSAAVGILMNTRGLMELIVLNIGLDMKVLSPTLFAMLVIMAVITTIATTPILDRLRIADEPLAEPELAHSK